MSDSVLGDVVSVLDLIVLERLPGGAFVQLGGQRPPKWFADAFTDAGVGDQVTMLQAFPILDSFLSEAGVFWERTVDGRFEGEPFVVAKPGGENLPIAPVAVAMNRRRFLILQRVSGFEDKQQILQRARERALEHEEIVKRIDALNRPMTTLLRLTEELAVAEMSDAVRTRVIGIKEAASTLRQLLDRLPQLPRGATARPRG